MLCITGIQLSADIILTVYSLYRARKEWDNVVFKCINISVSDINNYWENLCDSTQYINWFYASQAFN
jgi:hypothetical protein